VSYSDSIALVPALAFDDPTLSGTDFRILGFIAKQNANHRWVEVDQQAVAIRFGKSRATVSVSLAKLVERGWIVERRKPGFKTKIEYRARLDTDEADLKRILADASDANIDDVSQTEIDVRPANIDAKPANIDVSQANSPHTPLKKKLLPSEPTVLRVDSPEFRELWQSATPLMRKRSTKGETLDELKRAAKRGDPVDKVTRGLKRYAAEDDDVLADRGQPALHRWIKAGRYEQWAELDAGGDWTPDQWRAALVWFEKRGEWQAGWPPRAQAPPDILAEFKKADLFQGTGGQT
jgi:hypothetical protein